MNLWYRNVLSSYSFDASSVSYIFSSSNHSFRVVFKRDMFRLVANNRKRLLKYHFYLFLLPFLLLILALLTNDYSLCWFNDAGNKLLHWISCNNEPWTTTARLSIFVLFVCLGHLSYTVNFFHPFFFFHPSFFLYSFEWLWCN